LKISVDRVFGLVEHTPSSPEEATKEEVTSQAWLAAEILCAFLSHPQLAGMRVATATPFFFSFFFFFFSNSVF
jgi:hypothetical protein